MKEFLLIKFILKALFHYTKSVSVYEMTNDS